MVRETRVPGRGEYTVKIMRCVHYLGVSLLYILLAVSQMVHIGYSYESWWPTISNISTYQFIWGKIQNAPFTLWWNLSWFYISGSAFYSALWDYIIMTGMTIIYFTLLKGSSLIWQFWMIVTSFYWWIKAIYLFMLGNKTWHHPIPMEPTEQKHPR